MLHALDSKEKGTVAELLQRLNPHDGTLGAAEGLNRVGEYLQILKETPLPTEVRDVSDESALTPDSYTSPPSIVDHPQDSNFMVPEPENLARMVPSLDGIKSTLLSSYRDFRTSISKVASLPLPRRSTEVPSALVSTEEQAQEELVFSRRQCELTLEEGRVWDELTQASAMSTHQPTLDNFVLCAAEERLDTLSSRSEIVAESYQRRMYVPTRNTYLESMEILEAMGVPCYEIEGAHEGEALASSLVHQGLADYVVSEDSVCLSVLFHPHSPSNFQCTSRMSWSTKPHFYAISRTVMTPCSSSTAQTSGTPLNFLERHILTSPSFLAPIFHSG